MSGEASSKADITLPGKQREMLSKLLESGKTGCNGTDEWSSAGSWLGSRTSSGYRRGLASWNRNGKCGGKLLLGDVNPSGKRRLPFHP